MIKVTTYKDATTQMSKILGWNFVTKEQADEITPIPGELYIFEESKVPPKFFENYDDFCIRDGEFVIIYPTVGALDDNHPLRMGKTKEPEVHTSVAPLDPTLALYLQK